MFEVYVASKNMHKVSEYNQLLESLGWNISPLPDNLPDCPENGITFESNAMEKAAFYSQQLQHWVLADDSGLVVPALDGEPGVRSARYAGSHGDYIANNNLLLERLRQKGGLDRTARFVCSIALWSDKLGRGTVVRGAVEGRILEQPRGQGGFGYDPLFEYVPLQKSFAQMSASEKNRVSHRSRAVQALAAVWKGGLESALLRGE